MDPGVGSLTGGSKHVLTIDNVVAGSNITVNWAFQPSATSTIDFVQATTTRRIVSSSQLTTVVASGGKVEIVFSAQNSVTSSPFDGSDDPATTWVLVQAYKDYIVTAKAGDTTVTAYLRQIPGPTSPPVPQAVRTLTWKPTAPGE